MAKASSNEVGTGGHPSVLKSYKTTPKSHKTRQGASRNHAKAILGLGKPLRSGQGAIRQSWNPIKLERGASRSMAKASSNDILGLGKPLGVGSGGHPSVLKHHKTSQGASRSMAKASSNDILGLGKPLGSGPGAIRQFWNPIKPRERGPAARQFWNPIKPAKAPAAAWLKSAPTTFWAWGSLWDRDRGPSVSFETP